MILETEELLFFRGTTLLRAERRALIGHYHVLPG